MHVIITDEHYLKTYERIEKTHWLTYNKTRLFFSALLIVCTVSSLLISPLFQHTAVSGVETVQVDPCFVLAERRVSYMIIIFALLLIGRSFYKRQAALKGLPLMREYEKQVKKMIVKYDFDETRLRIDYGDSFKETRWNSFQKFHFTKNFLILHTQAYPMSPVWIPWKAENKQELIDFIKTIQTKFRIELIK